MPDDELRALTEGIALEKAERAARKIAEKEGFLGILKLVRIRRKDEGLAGTRARALKITNDYSGQWGQYPRETAKTRSPDSSFRRAGRPVRRSSHQRCPLA